MEEKPKVLVVDSGLNKLIKPEKKKKKCLVKDCDNMTNHNKGFCSVECYKNYKKTLKLDV